MIKTAKVEIHQAYIKKLDNGELLEGTKDPESEFFEDLKIKQIRFMTKNERKLQIANSRSGAVPSIIELKNGQYIAAFISEFNEQHDR